MVGGQDTQQMLNYIRDQLYTPIPTPDLIKDDVSSFRLISPKPALLVPGLRNLEHPIWQLSIGTKMSPELWELPFSQTPPSNPQREYCSTMSGGVQLWSATATPSNKNVVQCLASIAVTWVLFAGAALGQGTEQLATHLDRQAAGPCSGLREGPA